MRWEVKEVRPIRVGDISTALTLSAHFGERMLVRDADLFRSAVIGTNPFVEQYLKMRGFVVKEKDVPVPSVVGYSADESFIDNTWQAYHKVERKGKSVMVETKVSVSPLSENFAREYRSYDPESDLNDFLFLDDRAMQSTETRRGDQVLILPEPVLKGDLEPVRRDVVRKEQPSYIR